jgi:hypothetical protein
MMVVAMQEPPGLDDTSLMEWVTDQRVRRRRWWQIALDLNEAGELRGEPWERETLRAWWRARHVSGRGEAADEARRAHRIKRLALALYLEHRARPDRCQCVIRGLAAAGITATPRGGKVSQQWVSVLAERAGIRVPANAYSRPRLRGDCRDEPRPCPWATCRYHLAGDVLRATQRSYSRDDRRPFPRSWGPRILAGDLSMLEHTCALDVAERHLGGLTAPGIGAIMGVSREWVRLVIRDAFRGLRHSQPDVVEFLQAAYAQSKQGGKPGEVEL